MSKKGETTKFKKNEERFRVHKGWSVYTDIDGALCFPEHIAITRQRPDMVLWCDEEKRILLVELTVPWEGNMEWAHERKMRRYEELEEECRAKGWSARTYAVEVGCRGFVGRSVGRFLRDVGVKPKSVTRKLQEAAESASAWIWSKHQIKKQMPV